MIGRVEETSASFEARSAPRLYPTAVSVATIGAAAIFLAARAGLGGLAERAGPHGSRLKAGFAANALNYLLVLCLVPIFPFWLVNLVAALAGMRFGAYVLGTFVGIIPGSLVYVSLGNGMGDIVATSRAPIFPSCFNPACCCRSSALRFFPSYLCSTSVGKLDRKGKHERSAIPSLKSE